MAALIRKKAPPQPKRRQKSTAGDDNLQSGREEPGHLESGDVIDRRFRLGRLLGQGGFGVVYECEDARSKETYAIKIELRKPRPNMPGLSLETSVLKRLQKGTHFAKFIHSGSSGGNSFLIMQLLGKNLTDLRRACPDRKLSLSSLLRSTGQCFEAIEQMHQVGILHRDIKPGNFTIGATKAQEKTIYLLDFGLVRKYTRSDGKIRPKRARAAFRGTRRYASVNSLRDVDYGRHDDLLSWIYSVVELGTGKLPWSDEKDRRQLAKQKVSAAEKGLFDGVPKFYEKMYEILAKMDYYEDPPYSRFKRTIVDALKAKNYRMEEKYDWELESAARTIATMMGPAKRAAEENVSMGDEDDSDHQKLTSS